MEIKINITIRSLDELKPIIEELAKIKKECNGYTLSVNIILS